MDLPQEHISFPRRLLKSLGARGFKDNPVLKICIGASFLGLVVIMHPYSESVVQSYSVGSIWADNDVVAPFSFAVYKDLHQYEKEVEAARRAVYPVYDVAVSSEPAQLGMLQGCFHELRLAIDARISATKTRLHDDSLAVEKTTAQLQGILSGADLGQLVQWKLAEKRGSRQLLTKLEQSLPEILKDVYRVGLIDQVKMKQSPLMVAIRKGTTEELVPSQRVFDIEDARSMAVERAISMFGEGDTSEIAVKIVQAFLRPNIVFNQHETERAVQVALDNVPRTIGFVQEGEHIINTRERISDEIKLKLDSYFRARSERGAEHSVIGQRLGILFHAGLVIGLFGMYLFLFRKRIFHDNAMLALIVLLMSMETFFGYLSITLDVPQPIQYLIFVPAASMLLTIIFDSRVGFYGTVTMAFLIAGIRGNDYSIALVSLVAGTLAAYTVRDIHHRTQIFRSIVFIMLGYAVAIVALALERFEPINVVTVSLAFAVANAVFSPVITYAVLILFERLFKVSTDLTLHELSDFNHPLLRQLSEHAPGTFHHSMTLGSLAEAAAESIGANSILARVGAYYHDVGKIHKPEYFRENQIGSVNRHNRLKPRMSALIISSHVKEGVELGRKYGLPERVIDIIPQHHGTTRMSYFFDKALKQAAAKKNPKDVINEDDFRYPGPKPQTKEAGIVMLADSVEASTRSIAEMTPQHLESSIEGMIKQRFIEGELDECDLTLRDLSKIKEAFLQILIGIHHQRIVYPEQQLERAAVQQPPEPVEPMAEPTPPPAAAPEAQIVTGATEPPPPPHTESPQL